MCVMVGALAARVQADTGWWGEGREGIVEGRRIAPAARNLVSCNAENFVCPNSPSYVHLSPTTEESYVLCHSKSTTTQFPHESRFILSSVLVL